jgi:dephospho-CoA kinase
VILRVGLTGGIASGKSTVAGLFAALGCIIVDADKVVAHLYQRGNAGHEAVVAAYGPGILRDDGEIDRVQLSGIAFSSPEEARRLNALIHPLVLEYEAQLAREYEEKVEDAIVIVEATLLLEAGGRQRYEKIIVVDVPPELQLERASGRGMDPDEAARRMAHQMPREQRLAAADYVIVNSGSLDETTRAVREVHDHLMADLAAKKSPGPKPGAAESD